MLLQLFYFIAVVFDLLLCLIYKLKFIIDMYVQKKKKTGVLDHISCGLGQAFIFVWGQLTNRTNQI